MNYKMIATDLDGTLLYDVFTVSKENYEAIAKYTKMGGLVVPTSGRCFFQIIPELRECPDIKYCISSNGAVITNTKTLERNEVLISAEKFKKILEITSRYSCMQVFHFGSNSYMLAKNDDAQIAARYNVNEYYYAHFHKWCKKLEKWDSFEGHEKGVEMSSVFFTGQEQLDECAKELEAVGGLYLTASVGFNIEIVAEGATKGDGVERLTKLLGYSKDEIIGVGDSPNDIALLSGVGLPLAMENADDVLKAVAKRVVCHHTEHVVKYILENIIEE